MNIKIYGMFMCFLLFHHSMRGQVSQDGIPYSFDANIKTRTGQNIAASQNIRRIIMPKINQTEIDSIKRNNENENHLFQFAYSFVVDISLKKAATIDSLEVGLLYRLAVKSSDAYSINIIFNKYYLPIGAKLFMYSQHENHLIGAFTSNNNKKSGVLPVQPVKGDEIVIEYFEPLFAEFEGELNIGKISHDFIGILEDGHFGDSGDCQVDINCAEGNNWQVEKRAICRIVIDGNGLCSGALLNNTNLDGTPYFLTANHCINNQSDAENSVFVFNYESPSCNGGDGSVSQSISGADLRATRQGSDFTLLELSSRPLSTFSPFYAGWNRNDNQGAGGVGIHHPMGDVKKISTFTMTPVNSDCISGFPQNNFYLIDEWIQTANGHGVTEGGSSGSPLFNNNHHVIGQLYGGCVGHNSNCSNPSNDYSNYGKIFSSWDLGNNANERLRDWLNPQNNVFVLDGISGCGEGVAVNLNITHTITGTELHQATNNIVASNTIEASATATYEAGNQIKLETGFHAEAGSNFIARISNFDCIVTCDPIDLTAWTNVVCSGGNLCFQITNALNYTIKVHTLLGALVHQGSGSINSNPVCIWNTSFVSTGFYVASISFSNECEEISNSYSVFVASCKKSDTDEGGNVLNQEHNNEDATYVEGSAKQEFNFEILPNPNDGNFTIRFSDNGHPVSIEIINALGKQVYYGEFININQVNINQTILIRGVYFVRLSKEKNSLMKKIVIQ